MTHIIMEDGFSPFSPEGSYLANEKTGSFTFRLNAYRNNMGRPSGDYDPLATPKGNEIQGHLFDDYGETNFYRIGGPLELYISSSGVIYEISSGDFDGVDKPIKRSTFASQPNYIGTPLNSRHSGAFQTATYSIAVYTSSGVELHQYSPLNNLWFHQATMNIPTTLVNEYSEISTVGATPLASGSVTDYPPLHALHDSGYAWSDNWNTSGDVFLGWNYPSPQTVGRFTLGIPKYNQSRDGEEKPRLPVSFKLQGRNSGGSWTDVSGDLFASRFDSGRELTYDVDAGGASYTQWRVLFLDVVGSAFNPDRILVGTLKFYSSTSVVQDGATSIAVNGDGVLFAALSDNNVSGFDTGWRKIVYWEQPWNTMIETDIVWPFPIYGMDASIVSSGKTVITFNSEIPGVSTVLPVVDTSIEPETKLLTSGGLIAFVFNNGNFSDHIEIDVLDIVDEHNYISSPVAIYEDESDCIYLIAHHSTGNASYRNRGWRMYMSTSGYHWSKGQMVYQPSILKTHPDTDINENISFILSGPTVNFYDHTDPNGGKGYLRPFWMTNFHPELLETKSGWSIQDITNFVLSYKFSHSGMLSSQIEISEKALSGDPVSGYTVFTFYGTGKTTNRNGELGVFHFEHGTVIEHLHGVYPDPDDDTHSLDPSVPIYTRIGYTQVDNYQVTRKVGDAISSITTRDVLSWMDSTKAEEPKYWKSQGTFGDTFNDWGEASYGAMAHTSAARGEWATKASYLYVVTKNKRCVAWNTFDTDVWNGQIVGSFHTPPNTDDRIGFVFRAINAENYLWCGYEKATETIKLWEVRDGTNLTVLASAPAPSGNIWRYIGLRITFRYSRVIVERTSDGRSFYPLIDHTLKQERILEPGYLKSLENNPFERGYVGFGTEGNDYPDTRISNMWFKDFKFTTFNRTFTVNDAIKTFSSYAGLFNMERDEGKYTFYFPNANGDPTVLGGLTNSPGSNPYLISMQSSFAVEWDIQNGTPDFLRFVIYLSPTQHFALEFSELNQYAQIVYFDTEDDHPDQINYGTVVSSHENSSIPPGPGSNYRVAFRQQRFTDNEQDVWISINAWVNDELIISYNAYSGRIYNDVAPDTFYPSSIQSDERFPFISFASRSTNEVLLLKRPLIHDFAEWSSIDPGESALSAMKRAIEGRYIQFYLDKSGSFVAFNTIGNQGSLYNLDDYYYEQSESFDVQKLVSHIRMIGAYAQAEYYDEDIAGRHANHKFIELQNPFLMSEGECLYQARREMLRIYLNSRKGTVTMDYRLAMYRLAYGGSIELTNSYGVITGYEVSVDPSGAIVSINYGVEPHNKHEYI